MPKQNEAIRLPCRVTIVPAPATLMQRQAWCWLWTRLLGFGSLSLEGLKSEARRVQHSLDFTENPSAWLWRRLDVVQQEISYREKSLIQERQPAHETPSTIPRRHRTRPVPATSGRRSSHVTVEVK